MKRNHGYRTLATLLAGLTIAAGLAFFPGTVAAQSGDTVDGSFLIGFRSVDVNGADHKYREDIDLEDGPRLFELRLRYQPLNRKNVDRVILNVDNFGGDPYETMDFSVEKFGAYKLKYNRTKSDYFYQDELIPPELLDVRLSNGGDFHHFDFQRVHDTANLAVEVGRNATLRFGFDRFTKVGDSTTTLDIQRDEFEFDKPIDESLNDYNAGFEYRWAKATFTLDETYRTYDNAYEIFLPGFSLGENTTNAASLDYYFLDQPYDTETWQHVGRLVLKPNSKLTIRGSALLQDLSLDFTADERQQGVGFNGLPFNSEAAGSGSVDREFQLFDVDFTYFINPRFAWTGKVWQKELDQDGDATFGGALGLGSWNIDTAGVQTGVQFQVSSVLVISGGVRFENRDVKHGFAEGASSAADLELEKESTDHTGLFATIAWRPAKHANITLDLEDSSYDDPFTLASPTDFQRYRLTGRWTWESGFNVTGSYLIRRSDNNNADYSIDTDQLSLRLGYTHDGLDLSLGYNNVTLDRSIDQNFLGTLLPIVYSADSDFFDARIRFRANDQWTVGGDARLYSNDGTFGLDRDDYRAFVEYAFPAGYLVRVGYRTVDYNEDQYSFDDYDADIAELGVGFRW